MKVPILIFLAGALLLGAPRPADAAMVGVSNSNFAFDGTDLLFLDVAGNPFSQGFVALSTSPNSAGILNESLVVLGTGNYPWLGLFSDTLSVANDGTLNGVNLYLLIGDHADPASSNYTYVLDTELSLTRADQPGPMEYRDFLAGPSTDVVFGIVRPVWLDNLGGESLYQTYALAPDPFPEPSSSILSGLAGLTAVVRRRRMMFPRQRSAPQRVTKT